MAVPAPIRIDPGSLRGATFDDLDAMFATLAAPTPDQVRGFHRGSVLNVAAVERLDGTVGRRAADLVATLTRVWVGKRFSESGGVNVWIGANGPELVAFDVVTGSDAAGPVLELDYNVAANPAPLRGIVGHARRLAPGRLLARMSFRVGERTIPLLWFTLDT